MGEREELLAEALQMMLGGKCPHCKGWGEVSYMQEMVSCRCIGNYRHVASDEAIEFARKALAAQPSALAQGRLDRETIARIIAPDDFSVNDGKQIWRKGTLQRQCDEALAKADAILALRAPEAADAGAVAWMVERPGDMTFPRLYEDEADAAAMVAYVTVGPLATMRPLYASPTAAGIAAPPATSADAVREALEAISMWCTSERLKIRGRGGFDHQSEREIGIGLVENELDRRARALSAPVAGADAGMRAALEPFAKLADLVSDRSRDLRPIVYGLEREHLERLTVGDLRRAKAAWGAAHTSTDGNTGGQRS
jgi:hypothetical protein